ncbi:hypothetical protein F66182_7286 [Fusarium sp. NRRL 66182]|nr:hypothetical protein F66182_7286 [Fusarium sp. NRRL 66182]
MRYSYTFSGLLTVAMSSTGLAQTPLPITDATTAGTTGGMNVPTAVTSYEAPTTTLSTAVKPTATLSPEVCCVECKTVYDECCVIPGADIAICKQEYTVCLGYNPWDIVPYVEPSICKAGGSGFYGRKHGSGHGGYHGGKHGGEHGGKHGGKHGYYTPEVCCLECTTVYDECCQVPGADIEFCKVEYSTCLGYNPYDVHPFVTPTVCKHDEGYYKDYEYKHGSYFEEKYGYHESEHYSTSKHEGYYTAEYCCLECTTIYDECCKVPGADIEICKKEYTVCLGYSPFDVHPWVEPTVCKHDDKYYKENESKHEYNSKYDKDYKHGKDYEHGDKEIDLEACCVECTTIYDECCLVPGADVEICKKEYTVCLGYSPFDVVPYVKPTVCKHGDETDGHKTDGHKTDGHKTDGHKTDGHDTNGHKTDGHKTDGHKTDGHKTSEEECCFQCKTVYDECCSIDGHDIEVCKKEYTVCLGYNPFDVIPWVEPTVCKHGDKTDGSMTDGSKTDGSKNDGSMTDGHDGKDGYSGKDGYGDKTADGSKGKGSDEECAVECSTVYKACCDASGAIIETCKIAYTTCLGYNPFDIVPFVEPAVCKHDLPHGDDVVIVNGGDRVRPALALFALGFFALLCKYPTPLDFEHG